MGKKKLPIKYDTRAYPGQNSLCSGHGVYPNGKICSGCSDCKKVKGYAYFRTKHFAKVVSVKKAAKILDRLVNNKKIKLL